MGISEQYFSNLVQRKIISCATGVDGEPIRYRYDMAVIKQFMQWLLKPDKAETPASRADIAKAAKMEVSLKLERLRLAVMAREISSIGNIEAEWEKAITPLKTKLRALPKKMVGQLVEQPYEQIVKLLTQEVLDIVRSCEPKDI
jgi:hypothetical protein